jgi:hypothetical protein
MFHILIAPVEFNQDTSKSAREHRNRLQRERRAKQRIESAGPSKTPQERSNRLRLKWRTIQQVVARAQPSLSNGAL